MVKLTHELHISSVEDIDQKVFPLNETLFLNKKDESLPTGFIRFDIDEPVGHTEHGSFRPGRHIEDIELFAVFPYRR